MNIQVEKIRKNGGDTIEVSLQKWFVDKGWSDVDYSAKMLNIISLNGDIIIIYKND